MSNLPTPEVTEDVKPDLTNIPTILAVMQNEMRHTNEHLTRIDATVTKISETSVLVADHEHRITDIEHVLKEWKEDRKWLNRQFWGAVVVGAVGLGFGVLNLILR